MPHKMDCHAELVQTLRETAVLASCAHLLGWDEQTYLPPRGAAHRAEQLALLAGLVHDRATSPRIGELLAECEQRPGHEEDDPATAVVREARRIYARANKLPRRLVEEISRTTTLAQQAWVAARSRSSFAEFLPWLAKVVALKREEAAAIGCAAGGAPYDALLDEYEPGATTAQVQSVFGPLRDRLVKFVAAIRDSGRTPNVSLLTRRYPVAAQRDFSIAAARAIGFDFDAGRLDVAAHPFCSGIGPGDCRLTTRYNEHHFPGAFFGTLHEAGHGIYEQGLNRDAFGTALGQTASLGIHESQSRLWENLVGRSRAFWTHFYPQAQTAFPEALGAVSAEAFYAAINDVRPSWIRVEADEVTYNLHIMLRCELEQSLIAGTLEPADVPAAWNASFARYFDMTPPDDAHGCLQDIHWSAGLMGYFPTYALGNLCAAQLFDKADADLGGLPDMLARGEFRPLKEWLNTHVHARGLRYRAGRLVELVTGQTLSAQPLLDYLQTKYGELYGLS